MAYNNIISRTDADALIPEPVAREIITLTTQESAALRLFRSVPMSSKTNTIPVLSALPVAYFLTGDTSLKQTTEVNWADKNLTAEEIAVIVPVPISVLNDAAFDLWEQARPLLVEAFARTLDKAIFFGTNKPASWPDDIVTAAVAAGNVVSVGTNAAADGGIAEDINDTMATVEADGFDVDGFVTDRSFRAVLRGARDSSGQRLLDIGGNVETVEGMPVAYAMRGQWPNPATAGSARLIAGDFTQGIMGIRQDITFEIFREGVVTDNTGAIIYNLMQQDMIALRCVARYAFQVANIITHEQGTEANRFPFGVLRTAP